MKGSESASVTGEQWLNESKWGVGVGGRSSCPQRGWETERQRGTGQARWNGVCYAGDSWFEKNVAQLQHFLWEYCNVFIKVSKSLAEGMRNVSLIQMSSDVTLSRLARFLVFTGSRNTGSNYDKHKQLF